MNINNFHHPIKNSKIWILVCQFQSSIFSKQSNTRFRRSHGHYGFPRIFNVVNASWTLNPSMKAVNCKIKLSNNKFILVTVWTLMSLTISYELKKEFLMSIWTIETYYFLLKSYLTVQICTVSYVEYFLKNYIWQSASFKTVISLNTLTYLTVNSVMDIILQYLQNFQRTAVFKINQ